VIRPLQPDDLQQLPRLWSASHSSERAADLQHIAEDAAQTSGNEHQGLAFADEVDAVRGAVLFRTVAGAMGTGEIEAVAAIDPVIGRKLIAAAVDRLRSDGARLIVAEYPEAAETAGYAALLEEAGFTVRARIGDYYGDGVPLVIAVRSA
jgi:ribosomal protein S18 acetylase RimI-like enzyme